MKKRATLSVVFCLLFCVAFAQTFQWAKQITGPQLEQIEGTAIDAQGNIYVIGTYSGSLEYAYPTQFTNIFFAKYNSTGTRLWLQIIIGNAVITKYSKN